MPGGGGLSRGRLPEKGIALALPIAAARGYVTRCIRGRSGACDIVIHAEEYTALITVQQLRRLHGTVAEMAFACREQIAKLRLVPAGLCRSLELWVCSPYGQFRFFRLTPAGLLELGKNGEPPANPGGAGM